MSGRPLKTTVDYFTHDCKHGKTIFILEQLYGNDGYAFWYKLLELLGDTPNHVYDCNNDGNWQYLLAHTKVDNEKAIQIINTLLSINKLDKELWKTKIIWCQNFVNRLADVYEKRDTPLPDKPKPMVSPLISDINSISAPEIPINNTSSDVNDLNNTINTHSKEEYSKVNNILLVVFDFWNEQSIVLHRNLNGSENALKIALKSYTVDELKQAIKNYSEIIHNQDLYFWTYKWTLKDFLKRGIDKFLDREVACSNYARSNKIKGKNNNEQSNQPNPLG